MMQSVADGHGAQPEPVSEAQNTPLRQRIEHIAGNCLRWVFTGALLVFLLILTIAINEALNFQTRVSKLVGGDEPARQAILVLHQLRQQGGLHDESPLPYGAMAVKLDAIRAATDQLSRFKGFGGSGSATGEQDPRKHEEQFEGLQARLRQQLNELETRLLERDVGIRVAKSLRDIEETTESLRGFELAARTAGDQPTADTPGARLESQVDEVTKALEDIKAVIKIEPENQFIADNMKSLEVIGGELKQIEDAVAVIGDARFDPNLTDGRSQPSGDGATAEVEPGGPRASSKGTLTASARAAVAVGPAAGRTGVGEPSSNDDQPAAEASQVGAVEAGGPAGEDASSDERFKSALSRIDAHAGRISAALSAEEEFQLANDIATEIDAMRDVLQTIKTLPKQAGEFGLDSGANAVTGEQAEGEFERAVGEMATSLDRLIKTMDGRTPVVTIAEVVPATGGEAGLGPSGKAQTILQDYRSLERFSILPPPKTQQLASLSRDSLNLLFVLFVGAIGSIIYMTKDQLKWALKGRKLSDPPTRALAWFFVRPLFGVFIAFAAYLMVRAGQLALGEDSAGLASNFNLPILSVVALFAGLLSWQALDAIESKGVNWFRSASRRKLWATGLENALRQGGHTREECATQIGRSPEQVTRWIELKDEVTPEMQDRLVTWLERSIGDLFGADKPPQPTPTT